MNCACGNSEEAGVHSATRCRWLFDDTMVFRVLAPEPGTPEWEAFEQRVKKVMTNWGCRNNKFQPKGEPPR